MSVELPGVNIDEEQEGQQEMNLDKYQVAESVEEAVLESPSPIEVDIATGETQPSGDVSLDNPEANPELPGVEPESGTGTPGNDVTSIPEDVSGGRVWWRRNNSRRNFRWRPRGSYRDASRYLNFSSKSTRNYRARVNVRR